jgi:DNA replication protein DnaC
MMSNLESLRQQFIKLRLPTAAEELDTVLADEKKAVRLDWLTRLLDRELDQRRENGVTTRIKQAGFPELTTLEGFDWQFNKDIDEEKIRQLGELDFIGKNGIVLFLGKPGTGKSHLAIAIGMRAAAAGHRVYWTSVKRLSQKITLARQTNSLDSLYKKVLGCRLWILDDWGVVSMSREVSEEVFDLLDRRKHSSAMILTSNRDVSEWGQVFPDPVLASAAIDRMFDRADIVLYRGDSYRLKGRIEQREIDGELRS